MNRYLTKISYLQKYKARYVEPADKDIAKLIFFI